MAAIEFLDQSAGVNCPACSQTLNICLVGDEKCAGCLACRGLLMTGECFQELVHRLRKEYRGPEAIPTRDPHAVHPQRFCPACRETLETHCWAGPGNPVLDTCRECSLVWLDRAELAQIVRAPGRR